MWPRPPGTTSADSRSVGAAPQSVRSVVRLRWPPERTRYRATQTAYTVDPMPPRTRQPVAPVEQRLREFWAHFDAKAWKTLLAMMTADAVETDDLAQGWLHGPAMIVEHFAQMGGRYEDSHTALEDVKVTEKSSTAVVTCVVHYQMRWDGQPGSWRWPTTMIFVREAEVWRVALLHTK